MFMSTLTRDFTRPFFIIGCVRSGTTMLRNILRQHPHLACPEETHWYRWGDPFGTAGFMTHCNNPLLKKHREIDGIDDAAFKKILAKATSRKDLTARYMARFVEVSKPTATRWFDKTPQNIYGAHLIASDFPNAKFVHMVRNPVEVVSSLRLGKVVKVPNLMAACAYWNEAAALMHELRRRQPDRVLELRYEDFTARPEEGIRQVLDFIGEPYEPEFFSDVVTSESTHKDEKLFSPAEIKAIERTCLKGRRLYGYTAKGQPYWKKRQATAKAQAPASES